MTSLLEAALEAARAAGDAILQHDGASVRWEEKGDGSPVTAADLASQAAVAERLQAASPDVPILSEEDFGGAEAERAGWSRFWCVDPLDGTKEFRKGTSDWAVHVALVEDGRPALGVVHFAARGLTFWGSSAGAFRQAAGGAAERIGTRPASADTLQVVVSRDHADDEVEEIVRRIEGGARRVGLERMGSSYKACLVASGEADLYPRLGRQFAWDTAAPQAVVEAAGGRVLTLQGEALLYRADRILSPHSVTVGDPTLEWRPWVEDLQRA